MLEVYAHLWFGEEYVLKSMLDIVKPAVSVVLEGFTQLRRRLLLSFHKAASLAAHLLPGRLSSEAALEVSPPIVRVIRTRSQGPAGGP